VGFPASIAANHSAVATNRGARLLRSGWVCGAGSDSISQFNLCKFYAHRAFLAIFTTAFIAVNLYDCVLCSQSSSCLLPNAAGGPDVGYPHSKTNRGAVPVISRDTERSALP
jgi:hypothetical protein